MRDPFRKKKRPKKEYPIHGIYDIEIEFFGDDKKVDACNFQITDPNGNIVPVPFELFILSRAFGTHIFDFEKCQIHYAFEFSKSEIREAISMAAQVIIDCYAHNKPLPDYWSEKTVVGMKLWCDK